MIGPAHATPQDLATYIGASQTLPSDAEQTRLLARAQELVDDAVVAWYSTDSATGIPTDDVIAGTLRDATCAQVEAWLQMGEAVDIESWPKGTTGASYRMGRVAVAGPPEKLAPRALRILSSEGLTQGLAR